MKKVIKFSIKNVSLGVYKLILMSHQRGMAQESVARSRSRPKILQKLTVNPHLLVAFLVYSTVPPITTLFTRVSEGERESKGPRVCLP